MISFSLVDVKNITSGITRSNFAESEIENLADLILASGGIIRPLVVKMTGVETYTVVDGHLEYYAAVRAKEKDPRKGEMANAFIVSPQSEDTVLKQIAAFKGVESSNKPIENTSNATTLESRLANIEIRLEKQINELKSQQVKERQHFEDKFKEIESRIPQPIEALEVFNNLSQNELAVKLQRSKVRSAENLAKTIIDARQKKQQFENYTDLEKSVKGLGAITILALIDDWSNS